MRILTGARSIRAAIKELLSDPDDERIAAVAYVGADALSFLSAPRGLTLYCWPQAGGTNPIAVEELVQAGADVRFVKRLHAKVYWSRARGALIGSANLTTNALGEQALQEAVVLVPPGAFDMHSFTKSLKVDEDFADTLKRLHEAHVRFLQRNPARRRSIVRPKPLPSFPQWMAREGHAAWRWGWYETLGNPPRDAIHELEKAAATRKFATFLGVGKNDLKAGVLTLSFFVYKDAGTTRVRDLEWWAPEIPVRSTAKGWNEYIIWFALKRIPVGVQPPFKAREPRFRRALEATINESGGLTWLRKQSFQPARWFLTRVAQHYEG